MSKRLAPLCGILVPALAIALMGASPVPQLPVPKGAASIYAPGNGDYAGFRIVVQPDGHAIAIDGAGRSSADLRNDISDRFFADLQTASRAPRNPTAACSTDAVPPGDAVTVKWSGKAWSGLACATDEQLVALADDAKAIERALYVQTYRSRPIYAYIGANGPVYSAPQGGGVYGTSALYGRSASGYAASGFSGGYSSSPYSGYPSGSSPTGSLPTASVTGSFPSGSLPSSSPYSGMPTSSLPGGSPFSGSPFGSSPYSGGI